MIDLNDAQAIADAAKRLLAERKSYERMSERAARTDLSSKQSQKAAADMNWQAMAIIKAEDALHAACVDGDIADLREPYAYAQRELNPSAWHRFAYTPPQPRALSERASVPA